MGDCAPLLCIPSHHSYLAEVEMFMEGEATGGLVLFYNNSAYSGILANKENILANLRGWQFEAEIKQYKSMYSCVSGIGTIPSTCIIVSMAKTGIK